MHLKGCTIGEPTSCILSTAHFSQHCRALVWCVRIGCQSTSCKVGRSPFWGVLYWVWPICSGTSVDWDDYPLVIWHSYRKLSIFKRVMIYMKNMIFHRKLLTYQRGNAFFIISLAPLAVVKSKPLNMLASHYGKFILKIKVEGCLANANAYKGRRRIVRHTYEIYIYIYIYYIHISPHKDGNINCPIATDLQG